MMKKLAGEFMGKVFVRKMMRKLRGGGVLSKEELLAAGAQIGNNFDNYGLIDLEHAFLLEIGDNVTFASGSRILCHDGSTKKLLGYSKVGCVKIGNNVFVGANAIILPNTKIGNNVIIGAGSVISHDIPDDVVVVGNPSRIISSYDAFRTKNKMLFEDKDSIFNKTTKEKTSEEKQKEKSIIKQKGFGFDL